MTFTFGDSRLPEKFWSRVTPVTSGCWEWDVRNNSGYGRFQYQGVSDLAHRWSAKAFHGEPGSDRPFAIHSCDNRICVYPGHLRWGSPTENSQDMATRKRSHWTAKTHCPRGHEYSQENTIHYKGSRFCVECKRAAGLKYYHRTKEPLRDSCYNGHKYADSTYKVDSKGHRLCLICLDIRNERYSNEPH